MIQYILDRLSETSTWRGLLALLTGLGVKLRPDLAEAIVSAGLSAMGIVNIFRKEKNAAPAVDTQNP
jgi:hypothetical protein